MSFGLVVLAVDAPTTADAVRVMADRCMSDRHPDGDLDPRIVAFYEELRGEFPDYPPYGDDSPWMDVPLGTGIDRVTMQLSSGSKGNRAIFRIMQLADAHDLVVFDPQGGGVHVPPAGDLPSAPDPV